jgi:hypothetical protein
MCTDFIAHAVTHVGFDAAAVLAGIHIPICEPS